MNPLPVIRILALAGLGIVATDASAQRAEIRCWTNDAGRFTCSDSVPPPDSKYDREIINEQGVVVGTEEGEITPEERAKIDAAARAAQVAAEEAERARQYDQFLLDSFLSVEAIERVRDRNLEVYESQARIMELYLRNLKKKLGGLLGDAERYSPYNRDENAPPIPVNLADDIARTESSIKVREQMLDQIQQSHQDIEDDFNRQIERFREITGSPAPGVTETTATTITLGERSDDL